MGAVLAALAGVLPLWCVIAIVGIAVALVVTRTIVTQIIRLRASKQVTASADALRLLEIEDSPRPRRRDTARKLA